MSLNIPCPSCRRRLNLPPSVAGRLVQCPACRHTFTAETSVEEASQAPVLHAVPEIEEVVPTLRPVEESEPVDEPVRPRRTNNAWQRSQEARERRARDLPLPRPRQFFSFSAVVHSDSKGDLSGPLKAQVTDKGLRLIQAGKEVLLVPPGGPAEHLGGNRLNITYDGRRIELDVSCGLGPRKKLAHDLAAYLRGDLRELEPYRYRVPPGFLFLALLPLAMTAALFGHTIWMAAGVGLALVCVMVAFISGWTTELRLGLILTGGIGGCLAAVVGFLYFLLWGPINPGDWKTFIPPEGRCKLLMPGTPTRKTQFDPMAGQIVIHAIENHLRDHVFMFSCEQLRDGPDVPLDQRFEAARMNMLQNTPGAALSGQRPVDLEGYPGREFVVDVQNKGKIVLRLFIVEDHLYMLGGGGRGFEANDPDLKKFFDSFEFTEPPSM
jgi:hypothetical protein